MVERGHDLSWFDPQRLISVGVISINVLKYLPCQIIHSLWRDERKKKKIQHLKKLIQDNGSRVVSHFGNMYCPATERGKRGE